MSKKEILKLINSKRFMLLSFSNTQMISKEPLHAGVCSYFISAVKLELILKIFYELDNNSQSPFSHNTEKIFSELSLSTQKIINDNYEEARYRVQDFFKSKSINDVIIHELKDVLKVNPKLIKDFKYDAIGVEANYAIDNIFINNIFKEIDNRISNINNN